MKKSPFKFIFKISLIFLTLCILSPNSSNAFISTISTDVTAPSHPQYTNVQRFITRTSDNTFHAVYEKSGQIFYSKSEDNGITWQEEQITFEDYGQGSPTICSDSDDTLHVVFTGLPNDGWDNQTIRYMKKPNGEAWSSISNIAPDAGSRYKFASISIDSQDNLHVAWSANNIWYRKYSKETGNWSDPVQVVGYEGRPIEDICLTVDPTDNVWIFWATPWYYPRAIVRCMKYDQENDTSTFYSNLVGITSANQFFAASDLAGNIHLTFKYTNPMWGSPYLYYMVYDNSIGSWSSPEILASYGSRPNISVDNNNNVYIAYPSDTGIHLFTNASGGWDDEIIDNGVHPVFMNSVYPVIGQQHINIPESYILSYWSDSNLLFNNPSVNFVNAGPDGGSLTTPDESATVTIPPGALDVETIISINGSGDGTLFEINTNSGTGTGLYSFNIEPAGTTFDVPITVRFTWQDGNDDGIVDDTSPPIREANLIVYKDGAPITGLCRNEALCNQGANVFDVQVNSLSEFVIVGLRGNCEDVIATMQDTLSLEMFTGKNAEKDYTGLMEKLQDIIAKFLQDKCPDALDKLNDFQNKIAELADEGKIVQENANSLIEKATGAMTCLETCIEVQ